VTVLGAGALHGDTEGGVGGGVSEIAVAGASANANVNVTVNGNATATAAVEVGRIMKR